MSIQPVKDDSRDIRTQFAYELQFWEIWRFSHRRAMKRVLFNQNAERSTFLSASFSQVSEFSQRWDSRNIIPAAADGDLLEISQLIIYRRNAAISSAVLATSLPRRARVLFKRIWYWILHSWLSLGGGERGDGEGKRAGKSLRRVERKGRRGSALSRTSARESTLSLGISMPATASPRLSRGSPSRGYRGITPSDNNVLCRF